MTPNSGLSWLMHSGERRYIKPATQSLKILTSRHWHSRRQDSHLFTAGGICELSRSAMFVLK